MSNRKLNSRPITDFFTPVKKTHDETVATRQHAATNITTTSTSSPSPSSLVTNPLSTRTGGPSSRLVTTHKKRKDPPVVSTTTLDASALSTFLPRKKVETSAMFNQEAEVEVVLEEEELEEDAIWQSLEATTAATANGMSTTNKFDSCVVVGNATVLSPNGNKKKSRASSSNRCSPLEPFAPYISYQDDLSVNDDDELDQKPRAKGPFLSLSEHDRVIMDDKVPQASIEFDQHQEEEAEEEEETDRTMMMTSPTQNDHNASDFQPIEIGGESSACAIIQPFCVESATIVKEENFFEKPFGKFASHL
ncbi:hypothetical protein IV203_009024 [Nitzschia inconspicua]|uniref:Uncharacterized protein n=1 Tax=Nitzschia inconspicua TaxID=303405 RepID=A0A9K3PN92_9STRA|nr:hypothetical protein IV203_009024 [Nitzschia inconspicua]